MLLSQAYPAINEIMSGPSENSGNHGRVPGYMDSVDSHWSTIHTPPYMAVSDSYTPSHHGSGVLTPISLADSSFNYTRASPSLSHQSQEFNYMDDLGVHGGLGINSTYQELLPVPTSSPNFGYQQPQNHATMNLYGYDHGNQSLAHSMRRPSLKRLRRQTTSETTPPPRSSPVRILPHPESLHRMEQERRHGVPIIDSHQPDPPKPRSSGRGRRDPQAEEEDLFVENLRAQNLSWKIVAEMFRERFGKNSSEARLQMRMLRRRKSAAAWQEADILLLREAFRYWQNKKYIIIAAKLQELGATQYYTAEQIKSQLQTSAHSRSDDADECAVTSETELSVITSPSKKRKTLHDDE